MYVCVCAQSYPTLCDPMDCSPLSSVHGIFLARILKWVAMPVSRGPSWPRMEPMSRVSCIGRWVLYQLSHQGSPTNICIGNLKLCLCLVWKGMFKSTFWDIFRSKVAAGLYSHYCGLIPYSYSHEGENILKIKMILGFCACTEMLLLSATALRESL